MNIEDAQYKYDNDTKFHALVDLFQYNIHNMYFAPHELRAAIFLATLLLKDNHTY